MKTLQFLMISLCCVFIYSCKTNLDSNENDEIIPLSVGNYWVWEETHISSGNIGHNEMEIFGTLQADNETWYTLSNSNSGVCLRNDKSGLWSASYRDSMLVNEEVLIFKYPTKIGEKFFFDSFFFDSRECIEKKTKYIDFEGCYVYKDIDDSDRGNYYLNYVKPNTGWIGTERFDDYQLIYYTKLIMYEIN